MTIDMSVILSIFCSFACIITFFQSQFSMSRRNGRFEEKVEHFIERIKTTEEKVSMLEREVDAASKHTQVQINLLEKQFSRIEVILDNIRGSFNELKEEIKKK